ncbi:redoxin domain-containing protein [Shewanella sp. AS16]|uniref:TlpA family protein disulfide reductase n=1 Tax=Shewanella sp. AS16 TaxID=2907625 RepID=UPI001F18470F|nr:redoxin domain-containing protein [Shewanella sp. AS16]MCE9687121.1 redoxin domain-containing protein [Shewanella sp. AS16]
MTLRWLLSLLLLVAAPLAAKTELAETRLDAAALAQLKQAHLGQRWLVLCWSLDCPACLKELSQIAALQRRYENLALVFINTDADDELEPERQQRLAQFELSGFRHLYFADGLAAQSRYVLDSGWYGELPRSYFVDELGHWRGSSGLLEAAQIRQWLVPGGVNDTHVVPAPAAGQG